MKKTLAGTLFVLALLGLVAGTAVAGGKEVKTRVGIEYDDRGSTAPNYDVAVFLGTVRADKKTCRKSRKVSVSTVSGQSVGSDRTTDGGKFEVDASGFGPGNYVVKVSKKKTGKLTCRTKTKSFSA